MNQHGRCVTESEHPSQKQSRCTGSCAYLLMLLAPCAVCLWPTELLAQWVPPCQEVCGFLGDFLLFLRFLRPPGCHCVLSRGALETETRAPALGWGCQLLCQLFRRVCHFSYLWASCAFLASRLPPTPAGRTAPPGRCGA